MYILIMISSKENYRKKNEGKRRQLLNTLQDIDIHV